ncbi:MAG: CPBP family intramembrane glutamic endopeptidase [Chitinophagales bacterium]
MKGASGSIGSRSWILYERLSGAVILGGVPAVLLLILSPVTVSKGELFEISIKNSYLVPVACTTILVINFFATRKASNRNGYPLFRAEVWSASTLLFNQSTWAVYLFAYEFLFRGVLLSATFLLLGKPLAILFNILIYALLHIHRGRKQVLYAVPFGGLLCWLVLATSTWISAALIHISFAVSYEFFVIAYQEKWWRRKYSTPANQTTFLENILHPTYETD